MSTETLADRWTVAQAKARLSEVIDKARHGQPQEITRNGKRAVVVVDAALWERMSKPEEPERPKWDGNLADLKPGSMAEFFLNSPLRGANLEFERIKGGLREMDLS